MIFIVLFINFAWSHSWVEQLSVIGRDGLTQGPPGYPRGNVLYSSPTFSDYAMTYLVPDSSRNNAICAPSQQQQIQTKGSPWLQARLGDRVLIHYQENGHVTLPWVTPGKPSPGTVYVYSTMSPSERDTLLDVHRVWNEDGTGGDRRGRLLGIFGFDDGQGRFGHAPNILEGSSLWCSNVVLLPGNINSDVLLLYWVWDWPTNPGKADKKQEIYTTCMDIQIDTTSSTHCM
ncbi:hypothetical protein BDV09DRAFT_189336 [Aspergillus tetrazonus]